MQLLKRTNKKKEKNNKKEKTMVRQSNNRNLPAGVGSVL